MSDSNENPVIRVTRARLSFPKIWTPTAFREGQRKRYEATFLLDPTNETHKKQIKQIVKSAAKLIEDRFGEYPDDFEFGFGFADARPIQIGDIEWRGKKKTKYDGYEGMFYINTANTIRPAIVDQQRNPLTEEDGKPYAGCYVNGSLSLWLQDNEFGRRINANLRGVQFVADGEAFGAKPVDAENEFDVVETDDIDDDFDDDEIPF